MSDLAADPAAGTARPQIRPARREDIERIRAIHWATFDEHAAREPGFDIDAPFIGPYLDEITRPFTWLRGALARRRHFLLVYDAGGEVGGYILYTRHSNWLGPFAVLIADISVDRAHRRSGIGRALVAEMERRETRKGVFALAATIWPGNTASRALFDAEGYTRVETKTAGDELTILVEKTVPDSILSGVRRTVRSIIMTFAALVPLLLGLTLGFHLFT